MLAIIATVVTHHVTSYVLVAMLLLITLAALLTANWRTAAWAAVLALLSAVAAVGWLVFAAPQTWAYLQPFADGTLQSFRSPSRGRACQRAADIGRAPGRPDAGRRELS